MSQGPQIQPPITQLQSGGPLLSTSQFILLLSGCASEGLPLGVDPIPEETKSNPLFQREWQDILASIALYGPARVVLPEHLAAAVSIEPLLELELAEVLILDTTTGLRTELTKTYEEAFKRCRELEWRPATTPLRSLDAPAPDSRDRFEAEALIGEADLYINRLRAKVNSLLEWLDQIFGYYLQLNEIEVRRTITDINRERYGYMADLSIENPSSRASDLLRSMGLYLRDPAALDSMGLRQTGLGYSPSCLEEFDDLDRSLTSISEGFTEFATLGLQIATYDPEEFLAVHAFWRSFFELVNMMRVAPITGNTLFLPSTLPISGRPPNDAILETTDASLRVYRLFLSETGRLPNPNDLRELTRLRQDAGLTSLREMLVQWTTVAQASHDPDSAALIEIQRDIETAARRLRQGKLMGHLGRLVTFLSLPVGIYDAMQGSGLGFGLTPLGAALAAKEVMITRGASWAYLGRQ